MGAWGYGPRDNDTADDWLKDIGDYCSAQVTEVLDRDREEGEWEEVRAACWLMERLGTIDIWPPDALAVQLQQGVDRLTWLRDESGWHEDWNEPGDLRASLDAQILTLAQMLASIEPDTDAQEQPQ